MSRSASAHDEAAAHVHGGAGDVARLGRREEADHRGDLLRRAEAAERRLGEPLLLASGAALVEHPCANPAGYDEIDRDRIRAELAGEREGEAVQARFRGGIVGVVPRTAE